MRIEASDFIVELVIKDASNNEILVVSVPGSELVEFFIKVDAEAAAAKELKQPGGYDCIKTIAEWISSKRQRARMNSWLAALLGSSVR